MRGQLNKYCGNNMKNATIYKIRISDVINEHRSNFETEFTNISEAIKACLLENGILLKEYGELEEEANKREWDLNWCYKNCKVKIELQKFVDDEIEPLKEEDYNGVDSVLLEEFKANFQYTDWAFSLTDFFYYSK